MQHPPTADLEGLIRELVQAGVELIIVGGAAAIIHGAPVTTKDLDIVPASTQAMSNGCTTPAATTTCFLTPRKYKPRTCAFASSTFLR